MDFTTGFLSSKAVTNNFDGYNCNVENDERLHHGWRSVYLSAE
jgi:hypothetical protein